MASKSSKRSAVGWIVLGIFLGLILFALFPSLGGFPLSIPARSLAAMQAFAG